MKAFVRTRSGSMYLIDNEQMTWERLEKTADSGPLRTDGGPLLVEPEIKVGEPMIVLGPPLPTWAAARIIMTTDVTEVRYPEEPCSTFSTSTAR